MAFDYMKNLGSRDLMPMERILDLLMFARTEVGGYERRWGALTVSCVEWLGAWHFICSWVGPRTAGIPEFRAPSQTSPATLLSFLYELCKDAFSDTGMPLPEEFKIGKYETEYQQKTRALTPRLPTVWADREFLRFCLTYIDNAMDWSADDYKIRLSTSNGQLRIEHAKRDAYTVFCPARGQWLGISEVSARDLFRRLPKRFTGKVVSLQQRGDGIVIGSRIVPSRYIEPE